MSSTYRYMLMAMLIILIIALFSMSFMFLVIIPLFIQNFETADYFLYVLGTFVFILGFIQSIFIYYKAIKEFPDEMLINRNSITSLEFRKKLRRKFRVPLLYLVTGYIILSLPLFFRAFSVLKTF